VVEKVVKENVAMETDKIEQGQQLLIEEYYDYAERIARVMVKRLGVPRDFYDACLSAASVGLISAAARFDPTRGIAFQHFAGTRIRGAILDEIRRECRQIGRPKRMSKAWHAAEEYQQTYDGVWAGGSQAKMAGVLEYLSQGLLSLHISGYADVTDPEMSPEDLDPEQLLLLSDHRTVVEKCISQLPEPQQMIIKSHYFEEKSYSVIGDELGFSKSWVSRQHAKALMQLRELFYEQEITTASSL